MKSVISILALLALTGCSTVKEPSVKRVNDRCVTFQHPQYDPTKWVYECSEVDHA